jgi:hypothetical protein
LKGGAEVQIGYVHGPDQEWMSRLIPFLGHKEPWFEYHISKALSEPLDGLRTRFYVGTVRDVPIANIMVVSAHGAGILGHVYTVPAWRRQGAIAAVMRAQMRDIADLDVLTLSTGYGSPAYGIYHGFGFRSLHDGSGDMRWLSGAATRFFEPAECTVRQMRWDDWPPYSWATLQEFRNEPAPRSAAFGIAGQGSSEGAFVRVMQSALGERSTHLVLHGARNAVVGWCHLVPAQAPMDGARLLDVHTVPGFESHLPTLLESVSWPEGPVAFTMSPPTAAYAEALSDVGFSADRRLAEAVAPFVAATPAEVWIRNA